MLADLIESLTKPAAYRRFAAEKPARAATYVAFLSVIFIGAFGVFVKLQVAPRIGGTFDWLRMHMPTLRFAGGQVTSSEPGPTRLEHPEMKEVAILIDTSRKEPVTLQMMEDKKVIAYLTSNAFYLKQRSDVQVFDLSKSADDRPLTLDAQAYTEAERLFDWIVYPFTFLSLFLFYAASVAVFGLLYGLIGLIMASIAGGEAGFSALFKIALHAQTASVALGALELLLPRAIPLSGLIAPALSLIYLWLGVRAAVRPQAQPPAAPA